MKMHSKISVNPLFNPKNSVCERKNIDLEQRPIRQCMQLHAVYVSKSHLSMEHP